MRYGHRIGYVGAGAVIGCVLAVSGSGTLRAAPSGPIDISNVPLFLSTGAEPNVMIMVDNSGSMQNIVPDKPYDPNTVYMTCPAGNTVSTSTQVETRVVSGVPKINYGGNNYNHGSGSGQRCFSTNGSYLAKLYADTSSGGGSSSYLAARYTGNYLNWYFSTTTDPTGCSNNWSSGRKPCSQSRLMIAKTAGANLIDIMSSGMRTGLATYNDGNGGRLLEPVGSLTATKRDDLKTAIKGMSSSGNTPLSETLADIGYYFSRGYTGNLTLHPDGKPSTQSRANVFSTNSGYTRHSSWSNGSDPIQYSCQKSFAVMLTDGRPQGDRDVSAYLRDYTGDCASGLCDATSNSTNIPAGPLTVTTYKNGTKVGHEYEAQGSDYLDDVAKALYDMDLRPDLVSAQNIKNNLASYFISFADDQAIKDPLMPSAAAHGGGEFFIAGNEDELQEAFQSAFSSIVQRTSSASAVATNSTRLDTDTLVYQARFRSDDWTGQLIAFALNADGSLGAEHWKQSDLIPAPDSRSIFTMGAKGPIEFLWDELDAEQQDALDIGPDGSDDGLGKDRLGWLRGDHSNEQRNGGKFRNRSVPLGDIINSDPQFVGASNFGYNALPAGTPGRDTYQTFRASKLEDTNKDGIYSIAKPMIYVGANDGMLHAFDAKTGLEHFAYVPSTLIPALPSLTYQNYQHRYFVDGQSFIGDAYINRGSGTPEWASVLVGTTGAGDRTVFALDVTNPHAFTEDNVLWEFTNADLGYVLGQPSVARMANGEWVAVFGNGYNSDNNRAMLFIVSLEDGSIVAQLDTGVGDSSNPNGLGTPSLVADGTRTIRAIYAGDLHGNLWKFDVSDADEAKWEIAYGAPLFTATDPAGKPQPITAPAEIGRHPNGGYMVYFGTGKFFETGDNVVSATSQMQSFYGIWDKTGGGVITYPTADRSGALQKQTILYEGQPTGSNFPVRVTSQNTVNWTTKRGWYLDLDSPVITGNEGERVVSLPILRNGKIIFPTLIPSSNPCEFGGSSWLMEMEAVTGARLVDPPLDINEDGEIDNGDKVTVTVDGEKITVSPSGIKSAEGIIDTPAVVEIPGSDDELKIASGTSGNVETLRERGDSGQARGSWRQLR